MVLKAFSPSDPNLEHEYSMLRRLHGHPSMFVQLHTAVMFGTTRLALEMEYIDNAPVPFAPRLHAELQCYMRSLLTVRQCLHFTKLTVQQALSVLHEELHLIHGDIKPDNVLYRPTERSVKLIDFEGADTGPAAPTSACPSMRCHC